MNPPAFEIAKCERVRGVWVAWFDCRCGRRHAHGLGDGPKPVTGGDRAAHCAPLTGNGRCPCGKPGPIHSEHVRAADRNRKSGYSIVLTSNTVVVTT